MDLFSKDKRLFLVALSSSSVAQRIDRSVIGGDFVVGNMIVCLLCVVDVLASFL